jgi:hypothetical protein
MKLNALLLAAAMACVVGAANADTISDAWLRDANHRIDQKLAAGGLPPGGQRIDVQMRIDGDGDLYSPRVLTDTASRDTDAAITKAVRRVYVSAPPAELAGRLVVFHVSIAPVQTASLPSGAVQR